MTTLNDLIQITATSSDAAIVVNRGLSNHHLVDSFAPTKSAVAVLKHLAKAVLPTATQEQRALNIHGFYGSGKSHLAVVIAHLLRDGSGDMAFSHFFERLKNFGETELATTLKNTFLDAKDVDAKPYLLVSLYGSETTSLGAKLMEGLYDAIERHPNLTPSEILPATEYDVCVKRFENLIANDPTLANAELSTWKLGNYFTTDEMLEDLKNHQPIALETFKDWHKAVCRGLAFNPLSEGGSNFVDAYFEAGKNLAQKHGYAGIVVIWDELGLALEELISNPLRNTISEIFDLQNFVEKVCAPARGHTLFLGLTHISFQEYASLSHVDESVKNRLEAIFGRFRAFKIELSASESEGYHLLGMQRAWTTHGAELLKNAQVNQLKIAAICSTLSLFKTLDKHMLENVIAEIYPLHPVMAAGLFQLSRMAQANRTALTFFRENAENLLSRPVNENALFHSELVRLPELVDYYLPTIKDKKAHELERYQRAVSKINADATPQEIEIRKAILKLLLLGELFTDENFQTNETFLACTLFDAEPNTIAAEALHLNLAWLKGAELIWKNDLTQQWTLLGDSGVNVEKLIEDKVGNFAGRNPEYLLKTYAEMGEDLLPILGEHKLEPSVCGIVRSYTVELLTPPISNTLKLDDALISGKIYLVLAKDLDDVAQVKAQISETAPANAYFWIPTQGIRSESVTYGDKEFRLSGLLCRYLAIEVLLGEKSSTDDVRRQLQAKLDRTRQDLIEMFKIFYGRNGLTCGKSEIWQAGSEQPLHCKSWNEFKNLLAKQISDVYPNEIPIRANNMNELNDEKYTASRKVQKIVDAILKFENAHEKDKTDLLGEDKETSETSALIDGILGANNLFIQRLPNQWDIKSVEETEGTLKEVLTLLRDKLTRKREKPFVISELRDEFISPPYGIPSCNLAIFAAVAIRDKVKQLRLGSTGSETDFATNLNNAFEKGSRITIRLFDFSDKQLKTLLLLGRELKLVSAGKTSEEYAIEAVNYLRRHVIGQADVVKNSSQLHEKTKELVKFFQTVIAKSPQETADKLLDLIGNDETSQQKLHEILNDFERVENASQHQIKQTLEKVIPTDSQAKTQLVSRLNHQYATPQAKAVARIVEKCEDLSQIDVKQVTQEILNKPFEECSELEIGQCTGTLKTVIEHHSQPAVEISTAHSLVEQLREKIFAANLSRDDIKTVLETLLDEYK